jgi:hypothetical protein
MTQFNTLPSLEDLTAEAMRDLPDLDDLLGTAVAEQHDKLSAKKARDRLAKGGLTAAEREEDLTRLRDWEARNLYRPVANVARFVESTCDRCGTYCYLFTGLFERQVHRHVATTQRYTSIETMKPDLDNEVMVASQTTPFCTQCMKGLGFSFNNAYTEEGEELQEAVEGEPDADSGDEEDFPESHNV